MVAFLAAIPPAVEAFGATALIFGGAKLISNNNSDKLGNSQQGFSDLILPQSDEGQQNSGVGALRSSPNVTPGFVGNEDEASVYEMFGWFRSKPKITIDDDGKDEEGFVKGVPPGEIAGTTSSEGDLYPSGEGDGNGGNPVDKGVDTVENAWKGKIKGL